METVKWSHFARNSILDIPLDQVGILQEIKISLHTKELLFFWSPETIYGYRFIVKFSRDNKKARRNRKVVYVFCCEFSVGALYA